MLIGELSKKTGLSRHTIRFYEKEGLIAGKQGDNPYNTYKDYSEETFKRLLTIQRIKGFGFTLHETAGFLEMIENREASCSNVSQLLSEKVMSIDQKINELLELKRMIVQNVENCPCCTPSTKDEECPIFINN